MTRHIIKLLVAGLLTGCTSVPVYNRSAATIPAEEIQRKWELVWSDEFNGSGAVDEKKWKAVQGAGGWGNQELQYYTNRRENMRVENGFLVIEAQKENFKGSRYTSARLNSMTKFLYGRFEIRAKLPVGRGTWPAIWMMPFDGGRRNGGKWPDNGEIDIMEHVGFDHGVIHASLHTKSYNWMAGTQKTGQILVGDLGAEFHTYVLEWSEERMEMFIDGQKYYSYVNPHKTENEWPFDQPFYFILNVAVGGHWGGREGVDDQIFPQKMLVDYVRVYRPISPLGSPLAASQ